ncbi:MAG TPA: biopolymer transporter ExbB, partial [Candidatus Paceibacterota bacterium]|nr:biopolymer transporter ExbB [Candidatus Paceibacterota bacterium]
MNAPFFAAATAKQAELLYIWGQATPEAKAIIVCLLMFSILAWSVMIAKALQMRRAKKLNLYFTAEYRTQKHVLDVFDRRVQAEGCPLFMVY